MSGVANGAKLDEKSNERSGERESEKNERSGVRNGTPLSGNGAGERAESVDYGRSSLLSTEGNDSLCTLRSSVQ